MKKITIAVRWVKDDMGSHDIFLQSQYEHAFAHVELLHGTGSWRGEVCLRDWGLADDSFKSSKQAKAWCERKLGVKS